MVMENQFFADANGCYDTSPQAAVYKESSDSHLLLGEWGRGFNTDDDEITSLNAIKHGLVWACVNVIAGDLGQIPLNVVKRTENGCELAENNPVHYLLNVRPNPYQTPASFIEFIDSQVEIWGNGFAEIVRDGMGRVSQLLPIPSQYMNYETDEKGDPFYYMQSPLPDYSYITFGLDEVVHFTGLTSNGFWGYRLVEIAFPELRLARANLRHASASYANGAIPSGVLQHPGKLPPEARNELRKSWQSTHQGSRNRGKTAILWEGVTYNPVAASAHDAQLIESIQHNPSLIGMLFQLAPYKLGDWSQSSTRANLEDSQKEYFQSTLSRRLNKMVQEINYKLFPRGSKFYVKPDPTELLKGDKKTQMETVQLGIASTAITRNEGREYLGMNRVEGGDEFVNPNTTANAGQQEPPDDEPDDNSEGMQNQVRELVLDRAKCVCSMESKKVRSKQKAKHKDALIRAYYKDDFVAYAIDMMNVAHGVACVLWRLDDLSRTVDGYKSIAVTRALNTNADKWDINQNARELASLILGENVE